MRADETDKKYALVQEELSLIKQQLAMMLEKQGGGSSTGTSRVHPHYDEDLDDHPVPWRWYIFIFVQIVYTFSKNLLS